MDLTKTRALVFDIDGTLAMMDKQTGTYEPLPGAVEVVALAQAAGLPVVAYTNGTFFPPAHYYPKLADAGFHFPEGHILTPAVVAARALRAKGHQRVMVLADDGIRVPLIEAGITIVEPVKGAGPVDAVMVGFTRDISGEGLEALVSAVWEGAKPYTSSVAPFVASAGGRILGFPGMISAGIEHATGEAVTVFGKPSVAGMEIITALTGVPACETVVVGDDPKLEIRMGRRAGACCVGVTTGIADEAAFNSYPEDERAHKVLSSLAGFAAQLGLKEGA